MRNSPEIICTTGVELHLLAFNDYCVRLSGTQLTIFTPKQGYVMDERERGDTTFLLLPLRVCVIVTIFFLFKSCNLFNDNVRRIFFLFIF